MNIKQFNTNNIENVKKLNPEIYKDSMQISIPFFVLHKLLFEKGEEILSKEFLLSQSELDVLGALYYAGGETYSLAPTQLYDIMLFSSGGMTKVLKKLEEKQYIQRVENNEDKRSKLVQITKHGIEVTIKALDKVISYEDTYLSKLDKSEQESFKKLLYKILD